MIDQARQQSSDGLLVRLVGLPPSASITYISSLPSLSVKKAMRAEGRGVGVGVGTGAAVGAGVGVAASEGSGVGVDLVVGRTVGAGVAVGTGVISGVAVGGTEVAGVDSGTAVATGVDTRTRARLLGVGGSVGVGEGSTCISPAISFGRISDNVSTDTE